MNSLTKAKTFPLWLALATLLAMLYLATARGRGYIGFPLDDAWIHQTYARNLGLRGEFAFTPGAPSTGSTSPLWTLLLSVGYFLHIPYLVWTYGLGILSLALSGFSMARLGQRLFPDKLWLGPIIGLTLVMEWHLIWASVSGMETILFVWLSILLLERHAAFSLQPSAFSGQLSAFNLGFIGGLLTLVRPEGVGLVGLIGLHIILTSLLRPPAHPLTRSPAHLLTRLIALGTGFLLPILPYLVFNYTITGLPLPNTFYAKQQEYATLLVELNFFQRWFRVFGVTLVGAQALLLPGLLKALWTAVSGQPFGRLRTGGSAVSHHSQFTIHHLPFTILIVFWWASYLTLYAIRLPVSYQHGRYEMPTIPWLLLLGIRGVTFLLRPNHQRLWVRVISKVWLVSLTASLFIFIALGAQSYANDIEFIETEMVKTAHWLRQNTDADTIIAAHDIGAIGYFTERPLVDLAGLITPQVIPFMRDEVALLTFAKQQQASYLATFPSWYPEISASLFQVYSTNSSWAIEAGYDNMSVYRLEERETR
ncbi:MAG TPA: hypothetical protein G4N96_00245 [Chloroflexi bacterium]|nr:hypothetical protein [Chloroflexota bacterium]